jgi:sugar lactone lactonase YvrE
MRTLLIGALVVAAACKGGEADDTGETGMTTTTTASGTTAETTAEPTTAGSDTTAEPTTTTTSTPTSEATSEAGETTGTSTSEGSSEDSGTTGSELDCTAVSAGPWQPALFIKGFDGSEDLAFDGLGGLALKRDGGVVVVAADMAEAALTPNIPQAYGTRFLADGRLLVALPQGGKVIAVDAMGEISDFVTQVQGPNGIYPDLEGDVWITEFGGDRVIRVAPDLSKTTIAMGGDASAANGIVYDPDRRLLFYTAYQAGEVRRVAFDDMGAPDVPELVVELPGTAPDGLTLDACGNLYVVDQGGSALYRVLLDADGAALAVPDAPMTTFPTNVANAQFGAGPGFDPHTLYLSGNPGDVYTLQVEFPGAPIVTVQ